MKLLPVIVTCTGVSLSPLSGVIARICGFGRAVIVKACELSASCPSGFITERFHIPGVASAERMISPSTWSYLTDRLERFILLVSWVRKAVHPDRKYLPVKCTSTVVPAIAEEGVIFSSSGAAGGLTWKTWLYFCSPKTGELRIIW
ncbi:MAG: hypothetical protein BWY05_01421 [Euryarchaeota archaeon ADurb.Bin165]|nr:MAG: hypothetical protein BWY05_01421 [Euryarchaeota archaeon ADurb.Bin165]